ncbi:MAG: hypothetical protein IPN13_10890 [Bacteroidetes bacterium]|nr:hypothetical protein [Bacteroidota bacterium]
MFINLPSKRMLVKGFQFGYATLMLHGLIKTEDGQFKVGDIINFTEMGLDKIYGSDKSVLPVMAFHSDLAGIISYINIPDAKCFNPGEKRTCNVSSIY